MFAAFYELGPKIMKISTVAPAPELMFHSKSDPIDTTGLTYAVSHS